MIKGTDYCGTNTFDLLLWGYYRVDKSKALTGEAGNIGYKCCEKKCEDSWSCESCPVFIMRHGTRYTKEEHCEAR